MSTIRDSNGNISDTLLVQAACNDSNEELLILNQDKITSCDDMIINSLLTDSGSLGATCITDGWAEGNRCGDTFRGYDSLKGLPEIQNVQWIKNLNASPVYEEGTLVKLKEDFVEPLYFFAIPDTRLEDVIL